MYAARRGPGPEDLTITIQADCSMSWPLAKRFFLLISAVSLTIAMGFAYSGYWLVLPFTGLELLLLGTALYVVALRNTECEVLHLGPSDLCVAHQRGPLQIREPVCFRRAWVRVRLLPGRWRGHPERLELGAHGRYCEIARGLREEERRQLATDLQRWVPARPPGI